MSVKWRPGPFVAIFTGATWAPRGFMITILPVRGTCEAGDTVEVHWIQGDSFTLEVKSMDVDVNYRPATMEKARRENIPLRVPIIVQPPDDPRLQFRKGHFFVLPEDAAEFPDVMQAWVHEAPHGIILTEPGLLSYDKLSLLPSAEERTYHRIVQMVDEGVI